MTEEELEALDQLMKNRDHIGLHPEDFTRLNTLALMDAVPGLVAEVRRMRAEVERLNKRVDYEDTNNARLVQELDAALLQSKVDIKVMGEISDARAEGFRQRDEAYAQVNALLSLVKELAFYQIRHCCRCGIVQNKPGT